ncbi:HNH endonuclease signature motif containing protein [Pedococcus sp. 2YAF34]|uniref:HNH endonuclease signature motif containing protein n=1 Tax=Pedococcus sp. 2YAF34 TaxID=3233032 RepID=UPI003F9B827E
MPRRRAQVRHLWLRDRGGCTFPGCTRPAGWTDAHHLVHWADGGPTSIDNAALLCRAHHSIVHTHRYSARITHDNDGDDGENGGNGDGSGTRTGRPRVEWDLTPGSYETALTEWRQRRRTRPRSVPATT